MGRGFPGLELEKRVAWALVGRHWVKLLSVTQFLDLNKGVQRTDLTWIPAFRYLHAVNMQ